MKKKVILLLILISILVSISCGRQESRLTQESQNQRVTVTITFPQRRDLVRVLPIHTVLKSKVSAIVYPNTGGKFLRFTVKEGDRVVKHQVVAELERDIPGLRFQTVKVQAPIGGVVHLYDISVGAVVTPQLPLLEILQLDTLEFVLRIPERYRDILRVGNNIQLIASSDTVQGVITLVSPKIDIRTGTQEVRGMVFKSRNLSPGVTVRALVPIIQKKDALTLPRDAVLGEVSKYVFIIQGEKAHKVPVTTGIETFKYIEVLSGLEEGDTVVRLGASSLKDGQLVRISKL